MRMGAAASSASEMPTATPLLRNHCHTRSRPATVSSRHLWGSEGGRHAQSHSPNRRITSSSTALLRGFKVQGVGAQRRFSCTNRRNICRDHASLSQPPRAWQDRCTSLSVALLCMLTSCARRQSRTERVRGRHTAAFPDTNNAHIQTQQQRVLQAESAHGAKAPSPSS